MTRFALVAATAATMLASAAPALAVSPTIVPAPGTTVTVPGGTTATEAYKLVNKGADNPATSGHASAVQIAPRWVISSAHAAMGVGSAFVTPFGSSTVSRVIESDCTEYCGQFDLKLYVLASAIPAPQFPTILGEWAPDELLPSLPGSVLYAGIGGQPYGQTVSSIGWLRPNGSLLPGATEPVTLIGGDSGGGAFWFPTPTSPPVLTNILVWGNTPTLRNQQQLSSNPIGDDSTPASDVRAWLERSFASEPTLASPQFTTVAEAAGPLSSLRPAPVGVYLKSGGTTSVKLTIGLPWTANGVPRTGIKLFVNGALKTTLSAGTTSYTLSGLKRLTNYSVRVAATNANGDAYPDGSDTTTFKTRWLW